MFTTQSIERMSQAASNTAADLPSHATLKKTVAALRAHLKLAHWELVSPGGKADQAAAAARETATPAAQRESNRALNSQLMLARALESLEALEIFTLKQGAEYLK